MLICNLPEDVLTIVLRRCVAATGSPAKDLRSNLPLLAVCLLWRRLAVPLVYGRVFVQYGSYPKHDDGMFLCNTNVEEPTNVAVKTNLDLVRVVGCANAVTRAQIDVHCMASPFPGLREVIQRMRAVAGKWHVAELMLAVHPDSFYFDADSVDMATHATDTAEAGDALAALMPDVRHLECGEFARNPIARSLNVHLVGHYADQLQRFNGQKPVTMPLDCQFTKLGRFEITYDSVAGYQPPQMAGEELVDMNLVYGPTNHSWAAFRADGDSQAIEFTKLARLNSVSCTTFSDDGAAVHHQDEQPQKLHFPGLKSLEIRCTGVIGPAFEYAVLPPRTESPSMDIQDAASVAIPGTHSISLRITSDAPGDPSGLPAINNVLESARGCEAVGLAIEDSMLPVLPESITCTALTHLQVWPTTGVDTMLAFLERLPNLVKLTFYDLDLSDIQADMSIPDAHETGVAEPLHASLEGLAINFDIRRHPSDAAVAVAKYMLLRIPSLAQLHAAQTPKNPILGFAREYAPRYPHLNSIEMKLECRGYAYSKYGFSVWH
ncbi:hypothetical protein H4R21_000926 [Coemansia helicoidea]|uniref:Uncharacterized protein n=1 Tax=Coemansia helicoidea TaxID=1286919 RepID=A0ACC1LE56_9FUNG|nr:hypothetical protein H4R21_000926 [Coemansia helicoidea]